VPSLTDAVCSLHPGDSVFMPGLSAQSGLLAGLLSAQPEVARGVTFTSVQFPGIDTVDYLALHPEARQTAFFMSPAVRAGMKEGRADLLCTDYIGMAQVMQHGPAPDVAFAHLSLPDDKGMCSAGVSADFLPLVWARAKRRVAHLNPLMPRTPGSFSVPIASLDAWSEADSPLLSYSEPEAGELDLRIAHLAAGLIRDGDTLQFGIGTVPLALGTQLAQHRRLKLHAGMVTSTMQRLWEAGALDHDARITAGVVLGDAGLYDFASQLEPLWLTDVRHTHSVAAIGAIPRFVAVNSAVEVDLFGQVNAERAEGRLMAGAGGLPAFAQGAWASEGGRLMICLRATASRGTVSRIVPVLADQGLCTLPRHLADTVITEHGVAELKGLSLHQRAEALIRIAAPSHQGALQAAWSRIASTL
jgi:acyl-CoA hydrolase